MEWMGSGFVLGYNVIVGVGKMGIGQYLGLLLLVMLLLFLLLLKMSRLIFIMAYSQKLQRHGTKICERSHLAIFIIIRNICIAPFFC